MNKKIKETLINIGTGIDYSIKDYVKLFLKILIPNKKINIIFDNLKPNGTPRKLLDVKLAKKYGWKFKTNLKDEFLLRLKIIPQKKIRKLFTKFLFTFYLDFV